MNRKNANVPKHARIRVGKRAHYDRETVHAILDTGLVAHVGFVLDERPMVIPMAYTRIDDRIYIHGAKAARIIKKNKSVPACLTVTQIDGMVMARSAFHHSVNYHSVVIHGQLTDVQDKDEKLEALIAITDHVLPGRWAEVRDMTPKEFDATGVLALDIEVASAKIRNGPPVDDTEDYALQIWAGILPVKTGFEEAISDESGVEMKEPASIAKAQAKFGGL